MLMLTQMVWWSMAWSLQRSSSESARYSRVENLNQGEGQKQDRVEAMPGRSSGCQEYNHGAVCTTVTGADLICLTSLPPHWICPLGGPRWWQWEALHEIGSNEKGYIVKLWTYPVCKSPLTGYCGWLDWAVYNKDVLKKIKNKIMLS